MTSGKIQIRGTAPRPVELVKTETVEGAGETYCFCQSRDYSRFLKVRQATGIPRGPGTPQLLGVPCEQTVLEVSFTRRFTIRGIL